MCKPEPEESRLLWTCSAENLFSSACSAASLSNLNLARTGLAGFAGTGHFQAGNNLQSKNE